MNSCEICLWLDERWYKALSKHLRDETVEDKLHDYLDSLINQLPKQEHEAISLAIRKEQQEVKRAQEAAKVFSVFRVTEHGQEEYFKLEEGLELLSVARFLRQYLRQELPTKYPTFSQRFQNRIQITAEEFEEMVGLRMENTGKVTGAFDLDFDKRELSAVHVMDGWKTFSMEDVSAAAYYAFRKQALPMEQRWERLLEKLNGKGITSASHLSARVISFAEEICEVGYLLNFYMETNFNVDAVFGTEVCTKENSDWINVYANYDMAAGQACDELEIMLHRGDGSEEKLTYHLNSAEKTVLLQKMDAYCQQQTGQTLTEYSAQLMAEELAPPDGPMI